jgi:hypothetical protein
MSAERATEVGEAGRGKAFVLEGARPAYESFL